MTTYTTLTEAEYDEALDAEGEVVVYHGTHTAARPAILDQGLRADAPSSHPMTAEPGVYVSATPGDAAAYGSEVLGLRVPAAWLAGDPTISDLAWRSLWPADHGYEGLTRESRAVIRCDIPPDRIVGRRPGSESA